MKLIGLSCFLIAFGWAQNADPLQRTPAKAAGKSNPMQGLEPARRAGAKLFARECAACHGAEGQGVQKAPSLKRVEVQKAPPGALFWVLENGSLYRGMPSFAHLPEAQRWQIITYLQTQVAREKSSRGDLECAVPHTACYLARLGSADSEPRP
jgi:mono/diheme cytochrome c family protein